MKEEEKGAGRHLGRFWGFCCGAGDFYRLGECFPHKGLCLPPSEVSESIGKFRLRIPVAFYSFSYPLRQAVKSCQGSFSLRCPTLTCLQEDREEELPFLFQQLKGCAASNRLSVFNMHTKSSSSAVPENPSLPKDSIVPFCKYQALRYPLFSALELAMPTAGRADEEIHPPLPL